MHQVGEQLDPTQQSCQISKLPFFIRGKLLTRNDNVMVYAIVGFLSSRAIQNITDMLGYL